jgi:hypothetical protein
MNRYLRRLFAIVGLLLLAVSAAAQSGTPIPPGIRAADKAQEKSDREIEPPLPAVHKLSNAELMQQADELLSLAQQVHSDTQQAMQGMLAKDLKDKLKRMEKLSKRLRDELVP